MKFELHCHTTHSRGSKIPTEALTTPRDVFRVLKKKGFSGAAITDHDTTTGWKDARSEARRLKMVFIPGLEVSTSSGHVIGLGVTGKIAKGLPVEDTVERIHAQGGLAVAPHPFDLRSEGVGIDFMKCDAAEIFNSLNMSRIDNWRAKRKIKNTNVTPVGGSDAHTPSMLGMTANIMEAHDLDTALEQIRKAKVVVEGSYTPVPELVRWARQRMIGSHDDILRYIGKNYSRPRAALARHMLSWFTKSESGLYRSRHSCGIQFHETRRRKIEKNGK